MRISAEVAAYIMKLDSEQRGYPLKDEEVQYQMGRVRQTVKVYKLINGDELSYQKHWSILAHGSYKKAIR